MFSAIQDTHMIWISAFEYVAVLTSPCSLFPLSTLSQWLLSSSISRKKPRFPAFLPDSSNKPVLCPCTWNIHNQLTHNTPIYVHISSSQSLTLLTQKLVVLQVETDLSGDCGWYAKPSSVCHCIKAVCQLNWNAPEFPISTKQYW